MSTDSALFTKAFRTVIITGGNAGLGFESARAIARANAGWHLVLASRSKERVTQAAAELSRRTGNPHITGMVVDLASQSSIRSFTDRLAHASLPPLHAIICNAGLQIVRETEQTKEGIEATFGVNHLGHFLLVRLLLGQLKEPGRIVVVSSDTHDPSKKTGMPHPLYLKPEILADPGASDRAMASLSATRRGQTRYTTSKLCNLYFTYELARCLEERGQDITANAFNPGLMPGSGLARDHSAVNRFLWNRVLPALRFVHPGIRSAQQSGGDLARLVLDQRLSGISGCYWDGPKLIASSLESYMRDRAIELWNWSSLSVGLPALDRAPSP
ncbi:SDR family NAD(P)-dependent oxidoreductase [Paenibacillus sp. S150]|uniref:SDR family NAD(P)-dependent oxidoreductase n=1 Tax=Paenibacillus sp. S150 TaxID=2749826 RepID=UPI001C58DF85|nr:SDR family NAD(P)-dependent oxidoreductase [Paenibacillus sp. S150]MBW4084496.1 SDR family NAD(P)-dependent oxidoreductase [Paenibacillus sp. S150]